MGKNKLDLAFSAGFLITVLIAAGPAPAADSQHDLYRWTAPAAAAQEAADPTPVPDGRGAIFVPAMTAGADEPDVLIFSGSERAAVGKTGERILVVPGPYTVRVGSGTANRMVATEVVVGDGATVAVEPTWGGLVVEVVDTGSIPHRGTYELIRVVDREVIGTGYGADTLQGESLRTWLLRPGLYRIVRSGATYRARSDFATVGVPAGALVHFRLVTEPATGEFRGAGVIDADELVVAAATATDKRWTPRVLLGGAVSLSATDDVVGQANQDVLSGTVFLDTYVTYRNGKHFGTGILELEEGLVRVDPEEGRSLPTQKAQDRLRADAVYTYFINDRFGPYARLGLLTNVFASDVLVTEDTTVAFHELDGSRNVVAVPANGEFRTADAFGALRLREGFGLNVRLLRSDRATLNWRIGAGLRQNLFNDAFVENDDPATPERDFFAIDDFDQEGAETTLAGSVRLGRNLIYLTDLELFGDFDDFGDPTIDWRNTLSLRLLRNASLDYTLDLLRIPQVLDENQVTQNLLLRFSFNLL